MIHLIDTQSLGLGYEKVGVHAGANQAAREEDVYSVSHARVHAG